MLGDNGQSDYFGFQINRGIWNWFIYKPYHRINKVHALPAALRHEFLLAFVDALQPVFLVGAGLAAVTFVLAWMLKEVPLRTTSNAAADLGPTSAEAVNAPSR